MKNEIILVFDIFDIMDDNQPTININGVISEESETFPSTGLIIENADQEQVAEISGNGDMYIQGSASKLVSGVAYIGATSVYEWKEATGKYEMQYQNIIVPDGLEGKIEATNNNIYFYITDHLGSVRQVISETGELAMSTNYHSYGNKEQNFKSGIDFRESFTGKEFDRDGGGFRKWCCRYPALFFRLAIL